MLRRKVTALLDRLEHRFATTLADRLYQNDALLKKLNECGNTCNEFAEIAAQNAAERHNALVELETLRQQVAAFKWRDRLPDNAAGKHFWMRLHGRVCVVRVSNWLDGLVVEKVGSLTTWPLHALARSAPDARFAGPIPEPETP